MDGEPTVSRTPVTRDADPLVPRMPMRNVPSVAAALAVRVSVAVPVPPAINDELNVAVTPAGKLKAVRSTPAIDVAVTVKLAVVFTSSLCVPGETLSVKAEGVA